MIRTPTPQQAACIAAISTLDMLKIEACAGSGKTATLALMAEATPVASLYLAFNKVTATEATERFPKHVTCRTTHSLAYAAFGSKIRDKLARPKGRYVNVAGTGSEIGKFYKVSPIQLSDDVDVSQAFLGLLIKKTVASFEQSADDALTMRHLPRGELIALAKKSGAGMSYTESVILTAAQQLWKDRINSNKPVLATHDTYLKMYQLSKPVLTGFEILYLDEAQDTTPCVFDIVMQQQGKVKIIAVGDAFQAIYGFRGAVNAMEMLKCPARSLTKSFRYGQAIADVATAVLEGSLVIQGNGKTSVASMECVDTGKPYARLFRTNSALLTEAVREVRKGTKVAIEIDTKDFVKLMLSAVALKGDDKKNVKHDKLLPFQHWGDLLSEAKSDPELGRIAKIVGEGKADEWIDVLNGHVNAIDPLVTFTTCHRAKGRQWKQVRVEDDFKPLYNDKGEYTPLSMADQNLLYVALTRAEEVLEYNKTTADYLERYEGNNLKRA